MSLNTLAREVVERRTTPQARATASASAGSGQDALTSLTKYLPTETITLYIAGVAYIKADAPGWYWWFWGFLLVLTPAIVYLMTFIKLREVDASAHVSMTTCDMGFRMAASAISFAIWSQAIPDASGTPQKLVGFAAVLAVFVSMLFSLVEKWCAAVGKAAGT